MYFECDQNCIANPRGSKNTTGIRRCLESEILWRIKQGYKLSTNEKIYWLGMIELVEMITGKSIDGSYKRRFTKVFMLKKTAGIMKELMKNWIYDTQSVRYFRKTNCYNIIVQDMIRKIRFDFQDPNLYYVIFIDKKEINTIFYRMCRDILNICFGSPLDEENSLSIEHTLKVPAKRLIKSLQTYINKEVNPPKFDDRDALYKSRSIMQRDQYIQNKQREYWLKVYGKCMICGKSLHAALKLSHIKDCAICSPEERKNQYNTLLVCADHDTLIENGLISIDDDGKILCDKMKSSDREDFLLNQFKTCWIHPEMKEFLNWHRENKYYKRV